MEDWGQRKLTVALHIDPTGIEIQIQDREKNELMRFNEGSAGLQRYVALIAFVYHYAEAQRENPVLLIDEAETHLHYEAQAELVRVLERQAAAQSVIYTTHSIGCLPKTSARQSVSLRFWNTSAVGSWLLPGPERSASAPWSWPWARMRWHLRRHAQL